jgi:hypothetical protein
LPRQAGGVIRPYARLVTRLKKRLQTLVFEVLDHT